MQPDRVKLDQAATSKNFIRNGRTAPGAPQKNDVKVGALPLVEAAAAAKVKTSVIQLATELLARRSHFWTPHA